MAKVHAMKSLTTFHELIFGTFLLVLALGLPGCGGDDSEGKSGFGDGPGAGGEGGAQD